MAEEWKKRERGRERESEGGGDLMLPVVSITNFTILMDKRQQNLYPACAGSEAAGRNGSTDGHYYRFSLLEKCQMGRAGTVKEIWG